jgi:Condensin II non structural maintenance of chromosomes subunit
VLHGCSPIFDHDRACITICSHFPAQNVSCHSQHVVDDPDAKAWFTPSRVVHMCLCRALVAANPAVRRNALQLLVDAFPLHDPDASQVP